MFNEDTRVKIPATIHFLRLGYNYQSLHNEDVDIDFNTKIFVNRFKPAIERINNRSFSYDEIKSILSEINQFIKNNDLGKEFYDWLINPMNRIKLIDLDDLDNSKNDFCVVNELPFEIVKGTDAGSFRPDITILINGIPLGFLEVKKPNNENGIKAEFDRMINQRLKNSDFRKFFNLLQFVSFSNNMEYEDSDILDDPDDVKAGSFYTTPNGSNTSFSFFREDNFNYYTEYKYRNISENIIKNIVIDNGYNADETEKEEFLFNLNVDTPCNRFITSVFDKERFLFFIKYGIMYIKETVPQKHIMRYPQFFATRKIIERLDNGGKGGIIWHTQGSGKTALAAFSNRIIRDYYAKKNIITRFFFIVDRLELLRQASSEFKNRGLIVENCRDKKDFRKALNVNVSKNYSDSNNGEVCVVNIHKIEGELPKAKNEYNVNVQRIFFIDEAHRSYSSTGEFFKNLMTCDVNGIYIALTGTPLLSKKERSNLKFGDYIHKYFYDKSIADGYTLRIKKENIDTVARKEIHNNLEIEADKFNDPEVFESDDYVNCLCNFIEKDFLNFRLQNSDPTIGGMVVCRSNLQAKKIHSWFEKKSKLITGLVISDEGPKQDIINKNNQNEFKNSFVPDMLIVNLMLTTGYDVKRLKKMYLLRGPHAQSLLQTISRVNRPYKSKTGKIYRYGYIVDFVDIGQEYDRTIDAYIKELEQDLNDNGEDEDSLSGLVIDKNYINQKYKNYKSELDDVVDTDNLEKYSKQLTYYNKDTLLRIRRLLNGILECETEFIISRASDFALQIDSRKIRLLRKITQDRIDFINLSNKSIETLDILSDKEVVEILYEFVKTQIVILNLGKVSPDSPEFKRFSETVKLVQNEIKNNKNRDNIKIKKLDELLQKIFNKLDIKDLNELDAISDELLEALNIAKGINEENDRLSMKYGGSFSFVKTYQDSIEKYNVDRTVIENTLLITYNAIKDILNTDSISIQGQVNFVNSVKSKITKMLIKEKLYSNIKDYYDYLLKDLYTNIQLFK